MNYNNMQLKMLIYVFAFLISPHVVAQSHVNFDQKVSPPHMEVGDEPVNQDHVVHQQSESVEEDAQEGINPIEQSVRAGADSVFKSQNTSNNLPEQSEVVSVPKSKIVDQRSRLEQQNAFTNRNAIIAKSIEKWRSAAQIGDGQASLALARAYKSGQGVVKDLYLAQFYFRQAMDRGIVQAKTEFALMLRDGIGLARDEKLALSLLLEAEKSSDYLAQYHLGLMFMEGSHGAPKHLGGAAGMFLRSARQGFAPAQNNFAYMAQTGSGIPVSHTLAIKFYRMAAKQGHAIAQYNLAQYFVKGQHIGQDNTQANHWLEQSARRGYVKAQVLLGLRLLEQRGHTHQQAAKKWLTLAAKVGDKQAKLGLARWYLNREEPTDIDYKVARSWLSSLMPTEDRVANQYYGYLLINGLGGARDTHQAIKHFTRAAENGSLEAQYELGAALLGDDDIQPDLQKAYYWLESAATQGHLAARKLLCRLVAKGVKTVPCLR